VVGAGISGLAAGFLFRQRVGAKARILILDNTDDFGGHAKRNEFTASDGRLVIGYAGSQTLQTPSFFTPAVAKLIADVGIDLGRFNTWYDHSWNKRHGLEEGVFFRKEDFGRDATVRRSKNAKAADWVPSSPLNDKAKRDLIALIDAPVDYLPAKSRSEKRQILSATIYADFLAKTVGVDSQVLAYLKKGTADYFGVEIDAITCLDAWAGGHPGFDAMDLGGQRRSSNESIGPIAVQRSGQIHSPLPRWQRLAGPGHRARAHPGSGRRADDGGARPQQDRLRPPR